MLSAIKSAREKKTPFLGVCLGMQLAVIEYARSVCAMPTAMSTEFHAQTVEPLVIHMPEIDKETMGATMRLGLRPTHFQQGSEWSRIRQLYEPTAPVVTANGTSASAHQSLPNGIPPPSASTTTSSSINTTTTPLIIHERHRHRYEVNPTYIERLTKAGLDFVGKDDTGERMEILELKDHPYFVGVQFHPEYLSRVLRPSMPYLGFVAASAGVLGEVIEGRGRVGVVVEGMQDVRI